MPRPSTKSHFNGLDTMVFSWHGFWLYSGFAKNSCSLKMSGDQGSAAVQDQNVAPGDLRGLWGPCGHSVRTLKGSLMH